MHCLSLTFKSSQQYTTLEAQRHLATLGRLCRKVKVRGANEWVLPVAIACIAQADWHSISQLIASLRAHVAPEGREHSSHKTLHRLEAMLESSLWI
jgi:hypothetical protein